MKIFEYKNSWYYIFDIDKHPVTGKRRQIKKGGFSSEREAQRAGNKALAEYHRGIINPGDKITFGEMARIWMDEYKNRGHVKKSSVRARSYAYNKWLSYFDNIQLKKINHKSIQDRINEFSESLSKSYIRTLMEVIKMIFRKAKEMGYIQSLPTEFIYTPKKRKTVEDFERGHVKLKYMEKDVLHKFLKTAKDYGLDYDYSFFKLLAYTGMRVGELLALKWSDIDFDNLSIAVNRRILHFKNNLDDFDIDTPKTGTSKRVIPIDKSLISALKELQIQQTWFRSKHKETVDFGFVFINMNSRKGYPQTQKHVELRLYRLTRLAEIKQHITPHMFRHTHTSLMVEAGVDLNTIMERLGHKNDSITREIYLHITKSLKQEAVDKFSKLMDSILD